jgi:hypothetical protein
MPNKITYTGVIGPGTTLTSAVFNDVACLQLDFLKGTAQITYGTPSKTAIVAISATTTITDSISSGAHTIVISQ